MNSEVRGFENKSNNDGLIVDSNQIDIRESQECDVILTSDVMSENKKCVKRKRSTPIGATNEAINNAEIDYIQCDNKRKKIDLQILDKENIDEKAMLMKSSAEPATLTTKNIKDNNQMPMPNVTNRLQLKYENIHATTVQKLTAHTERLRLEINTLRSALAIERNAVRVLR